MKKINIPKPDKKLLTPRDWTLKNLFWRIGNYTYLQKENNNFELQIYETHRLEKVIQVLFFQVSVNNYFPDLFWIEFSFRKQSAKHLLALDGVMLSFSPDMLRITECAHLMA